MSHRSEIITSIEKFNADYPDSNRVGFLMMKFENSKPHQRIVDIVKQTFLENGITLLRADDKEYHPDLFLNIETYLHCCGLGVAVFDGISNNDFNPNVSLEVGYMIALHKPVLHLKDKKLLSLPTDLTGKLYKNFDTYDPETTIPDSINKWLKDNKLCYNCFECYITVEKEMSQLINDKPFLDSIIDEISNFSIKGKPIVKNLQYSPEGDNTVLIFEGPIEFYEMVKSLHSNNNLVIRSGLKILEVSTFKRDEDFKKFDNYGFQGKLEGQICRYNSYAGLEYLKEEALSYLPAITHRIQEASIYITKDRGRTYFQSNCINFGEMYPAKIITLSKGYSLLDVAKLMAGHDLLIHPSEDEVIVSHIKHIKYLINRQHRNELDFDYAGARNVKYV